jgi:hypothetical protein
MIASSWLSSGTNRAFTCELNAANALTCYITSDGTFSTNSSITATGTLTDGVWYHVVFVIQSGGAIYIDGVSQTLSGSLGSSMHTPNQNLLIGAGEPGAETFLWTGDLQNVRIFNTALSASDVDLLYSRPWVGTDYDETFPYSPPVPSGMSLSTDTAATSLNVGLEGWWACTDASGSTLVDISGNGRDATLTGTNSWEADLVGTVNRFDNSSRASHAETANTQPDLSSGYTFSTWVKHEEAGLAAGSYYGAGIVLGNSSGSSDLEIYFNASTAQDQWPQVIHNRGNGGTLQNNNHAHPVSRAAKADDNGVWVHYTVTSDGSSTKSYRNGEFTDLKIITNNPLSTSGYKLYINELPVGSASAGLTCSMQNIRLYSRALTADEVTLLYERPWEGEATYGDLDPYDPPPTLALKAGEAINTGCIGWWPLLEEDDYASGAADISGSGLTASNSGGVVSSVSPVGGAADFQSVGDRLSTSSSIDFNTGTASFWIYKETDAKDIGIIGNGNAGTSGNDHDWMVYLASTTGDKLAFYKKDGTGTQVGAQSTYSITQNVWTNVTTVKDGTSLTFYVNGIEVSTHTLSSSAVRNTLPFRINACWSTDTMIGKLSNVRIWDRALSAAEVQSLFETPWIGSNYPTVAEIFKYIFRSKRFRRL